MISSEEIHQVIEEAHRLLASEGVLVESEEVRRLLADHPGTEVTPSGRVTIPPQLVQESVTTATQWDRQIYDRNGEPCLDLTRGIYFNPGSSANRFLDREQGVRPGQVRDLVRFCTLADALSDIDAQSTAFVPHDVPPPMQDSYRLFVVLMTSAKPVITGTFGRQGLRPMVEMLAAVRGGQRELADRPLAIFDCAPSAPLRWSDFLAEDIVHCAELGIPVEFVSMPIPGSLAPVYLHDALVQHTAETLSGVVISQCARQGAPLIYGGSPMTWDFRQTHCIATPDAMKLNAAYVAVGQHLGLATHGYLGLTDANSVDYQAGAETLFGLMVAVQAGVNVVSGPGMLGQEGIQSPEKLVLDNELCRRVRHFAAGISDRVYDADLWAALLHGNIMSHDSTLSDYRTEILLPRVMTGAADARDDAMAAAGHEVDAILAEHEPPQPEAAVADRLREIMLECGRQHGLTELPPLS